MLIRFDDIQLNVRPHEVHEWALTTAEVAAGYGVSESTIREHKRTKPDELIEGKHFVSVRNTDAVRNQADTWWTKKGVIRLGFFIKSERAKCFRDWAEDLVVNALRKPAPLPSRKDLAMMVLQAETEIEQLAAELDSARQVITMQQPKVDYADTVLASGSNWTTTTIAKELGMSAIALNRKLQSMGIQYYRDNHWVLTERYQSKGFTTTRTATYVNSKGEQKTQISTVWTETGRAFLHKKLNKALSPPEQPAAYIGIGPQGDA